jgi:GntR family transcriptional regulator
VPTQKGSTKWSHILGVVRDRIASGIYPVGSTLPTEHALSDEFAASRFTVREAVRRLAEQGLVSRRPKAGTVVMAAQTRPRYTQTVDTLTDLFQFAMTTNFTVSSRRMVTPRGEVADLLRSERGARWLLVTGMRHDPSDGQIICCTQSYLPERLAWIGPELPGCVGPFYAHIEARSGESITRAEQEIKADRPAPAICTALDLPAGSTALRVFRRYMSQDQLLIASFNWHPAEHFTYRMELTRAT